MMHKLVTLFCGVLVIVLSSSACAEPSKNVENLLPPSVSDMYNQTPDPTDLSTPGPYSPDWAGSGYAYTSDRLGITIEFPPEWEDLITISECPSYEGFLVDRPDPVDCIFIAELDGYEELSELDPSEVIAYIYWCPSESSGPEASHGQAVKLLENSDGSECWCHIPVNSIGFEEGSAVWNLYRTVEQGILNGEYVVAMNQTGEESTVIN